MSTGPDDRDVLEQNVSTLLEAGGEPPHLDPAARTRIRAELVAEHGVAATQAASAARPRALRRPLLAVGAGLVATAAAAVIVTRFAGHHGGSDVAGRGGGGGSATVASNTLADGTTWTAAPGGTLEVLGDRHVRVTGAVLLDVATVQTQPGAATPGAAQPFTVETTNGAIRVLGTRFVVDATALRTIAAVVRGSVQLTTPAGDVTLHAGEQGVAEPGRPPSRGPAPRLTSLVSWAAAARRADETGVAPVRNGTLFARQPNMPWIPESPLPIAKLAVDIVVENQVARVAIDQTFTNPAPQVMEGMYRFAIPPDASLQRLAMYVNGKLTESAVVERMAARRIYEDAVYRQVDPALLEWSGTGRLALRVYPLNPKEDKRVVIAYTESLPKLYDDYTLTVPLPEVDLPVGELGFRVRIAGCARCEVTSPSHQVIVKAEGADAVATYQQSAATIGDSLVLHVRDARRDARIATATDGADRFVMVRARPELPTTQRSYRPHTWVILDDVSASRGPLELRAQRDLVDGFLHELDEDDRVAVIAFDTAARIALPLTRVDDVDRRAVRKALTAEGGVGATDLAAALATAEQQLAGVAPQDASIVYLGDGVITAGARELDTLRQGLVGKAQFVGVGVGDGPDTQTLDALAAATGGYATTIDLADDVGWRAFDLVAALHTPRVVGVTAALVDAGGTTVPATMYLGRTQLADGEELELVGKLTQANATVAATAPVALELTGTVDGQPWHQRVAFPVPGATVQPVGPMGSGGPGDDTGYLPRLWAQRHIAARLLAKHEAATGPACTATATACPDEAQLREARNEIIRKEVIALGKRYFLLSRHTSLLVLEDDAMYARYGVAKGAGATWAPYALSATIPVTQTKVVQVAVAADAELVRAPLQLFFDASQYKGGSPGVITEGNGKGFGVSGTGPGGGGFSTRASAVGDLVERKRSFDSDGLAQDKAPLAVDGPDDSGREEEARRDPAPVSAPAMPAPASVMPSSKAPMASSGTATSTSDGMVTRSVVRAADLYGDASAAGGNLGSIGHGDERPGTLRSNPFEAEQQQRVSVMGTVVPQRLLYPTDGAFDDLTAFVPALSEDASDRWRAELGSHAGVGTHVLEPAARDRLAAARTALPSGVYRWGDFELAVDGARHVGWHRTTSTGLAETASFDGTTWTRRYPELGLDVTRALAEDDVAFAMSYLPIWIADPAHYARWFDVRAVGTREVSLGYATHGIAKVAYVLGFDDAHHLTQIRTGAGRVLLVVEWDAAGPKRVVASGEPLDVGFTGQPVSDAVAWAHGGSAPGIAIALPGHIIAYWDAQLQALQPGSAQWRHAQRQHLVSLAAASDRAGLTAAFESLRAHGGVELGDVVLGSGGVATAAPALRTQMLSSIAGTPLARYLGGGPRHHPAKASDPPVVGVLVGGLYALRDATALAAAGQLTKAADRVLQIDSRAQDLVLVGATVVGNSYLAKAADVTRVWDAAATGPYRNVARASAAMALAQRGGTSGYDAAAERIVALAADYDLRAAPAQLAQLQYVVTSSRRGSAGWQLVWGQVRDRVLASDRFDHVVALALASPMQPADTQRILDRALVLAGSDPDRVAMIAQLGLATGQPAWAQRTIEQVLSTAPSQRLHALAGQIAMQQGRTAGALAHLEAAQMLADPEETVSLQALRGELSTILALAGRVAGEATGPERTQGIAKVLAWATKWRQLDPANSEIDRQTGDILLTLGETTEAWRQLSTMIEHDPMSGDGYQAVAQEYEQAGQVAQAIDFWQQAVVLDQTNPTPRLRKAQALYAVGRADEGNQVLAQITARGWHQRWSSVVWQAQQLMAAHSTQTHFR